MPLSKLRTARKIRLVKDLNTMLNDGKHFSICPVRALAEVDGISVIDNAVFDELRDYHCVDYADMSLEERQLLTELTLEFLGFKADIVSEMCPEFELQPVK